VSVVPAWRDYQEEVAAFFRALGLEATTNETIEGARTKHDVDVLVRSRQLGLDVLWLVECKAWRNPVSKDKVFVLRTIVDDVGADRGLMMAERGYQSGALEAARLTNIVLTSLADLRETARYDLAEIQLESLLRRISACRNRYWAIGKYDRIDFGLRPDTLTRGYSGDTVITAVQAAVIYAMTRGFPLIYERTTAANSIYAGGDLKADPSDPRAINTPWDLFAVLDSEVAELEQLLDRAEAILAARDKPAH
jgi:restriction system protein